MTNFAFIMDLLKISAKKFLEIGFDKTLVSRWRRGKLRLMPNRHIVKSISALFLTVDAQQPYPVLQEILNIWYPAEPCDTEAQKQVLLERFLTEKGQLDESYKQLREKRFGRLTENGSAGPFVISKGIEAARLRILDFLDLVIALPHPVHIESAYPQGRAILSADADFNAQVLKKYTDAFDKGHRIDAMIHSDESIGNFASSYNSNLVHLLNGYVHNQYFNDFNANTSDLFLAVAGDSIALEVREEQPGRIESTVSMIYTDKEHLAHIREQIRKYSRSSVTREYLDFFNAPNAYLKYVHISPDSPCYLFTRLPHFGILSVSGFCESFVLTENESELISQEIGPFLLTPAFFWDYAPVRHIFCESAIENALLKKRHQSFELSRLLKRRVWMTTPHLIRQLIEIKNLLRTCKNYEVCFLSEERFEELKIQLAVWGYGASVTWIDDTHCAASRGYVNQRIIQGFCHAVWDNIPEKSKSRAVSMRKIDQWLEKARRYGYEIKEK